jgi:hypothetical protein
MNALYSSFLPLNLTSNVLKARLQSRRHPKSRTV